MVEGQAEIVGYSTIAGGIWVSIGGLSLCPQNCHQEQKTREREKICWWRDKGINKPDFLEREGLGVQECGVYASACSFRTRKGDAELLPTSRFATSKPGV